MASIDTPKVVGGRDVRVNEIPWQVYLVIQHHHNDDKLRCGGVLVDDAVVLTAAHCVTGVNICTVLFYRGKYSIIVLCYNRGKYVLYWVTGVNMYCTGVISVLYCLHVLYWVTGVNMFCTG